MNRSKKILDLLMPEEVNPPLLQSNPEFHDEMLQTISDVESSGGKNINHAPLGGMHQGERAFGKYGLTPVIIRETLKLNPELKEKYVGAEQLKGQDLVSYMQKNPELEDEIASTHLNRLESKFGQNPDKLGYAWLNGIVGTINAERNNKDLSKHWHVKKIQDAFEKNQNNLLAIDNLIKRYNQDY